MQRVRYIDLNIATDLIAQKVDQALLKVGKTKGVKILPIMEDIDISGINSVGLKYDTDSSQWMISLGSEWVSVAALLGYEPIVIDYLDTIDGIATINHNRNDQYLFGVNVDPKPAGINYVDVNTMTVDFSNMETPNAVYPNTVTVSGATTTEANGSYTKTSYTSLGRPIYQHGSYSLAFGEGDDSRTGWVLSSTTITSDYMPPNPFADLSNVLYYSVSFDLFSHRWYLEYALDSSFDVTGANTSINDVELSGAGFSECNGVYLWTNTGTYYNASGGTAQNAVNNPVGGVWMKSGGGYVLWADSNNGSMVYKIRANVSASGTPLYYGNASRISSYPWDTTFGAGSGAMPNPTPAAVAGGGYIGTVWFPYSKQSMLA